MQQLHAKGFHQWLFVSITSLKHRQSFSSQSLPLTSSEPLDQYVLKDKVVPFELWTVTKIASCCRTLGFNMVLPSHTCHLTLASYYIHTYIHTYIYTHTHTYTHTYIHTYIHYYIHTYIHTYIHVCHMVGVFYN